MTLIADSGATKTDWALIILPDEVYRYHTAGINPFHQSQQDIQAVLSCLVEQCREVCDVSLPLQVFFYGAGCTPQTTPLVRQAIAGSLGTLCCEVHAEIHSDLMGAARSLCGHSEGIACIMGTGSNSCLYDGRSVVANTPPLGYILGDEGSGASLGKLFLSGILKGRLPESLRQLFFDEYGLTYPQLIDRVYRQPLANRFLASMAPFMRRHLEVQALSEMVVEEFRRFFQFNLAAYDRRNLAVHFVGGVAHAFRPQLEAAAQAEGYELGRTEVTPIEGLIRFHAEAKIV